MKTYCLLSLVCIAYIGICTAGEGQNNSSTFKVFAIPGQNGLGSDSFYVNQSTGISLEHITPIDTPTGFTTIDFGQNNCISNLEKAIPQDDSAFVLHATSQGTATACNYLGKHPDQQGRLLAMVFEAVLASGNSAIHHTVTDGHMGLTFLKRIPFSYYWLPYLAKCVCFFTYSPAGPQAIHSIEKIQTDAPIVIAHSKEDLQLSYQDACALYHGLKRKGNPHVYFVSQDGDQHINLMRNPGNSILRDDIKKILGHYGLHQQPVEPSDLSQYQPDHTQDEFKNAYESLKARERRHQYLSTGLKVAVAAGLAASALKLSHYYLTASPTA